MAKRRTETMTFTGVLAGLGIAAATLVATVGKQPLSNPWFILFTVVAAASGLVFVLAGLAPLPGWIAWAWRARTSRAGPAVAGPDLDRVADRLAEAVNKQWKPAAGKLMAAPIQVTWGRPSRPLAVRVDAAVGSRRFARLPGLTPVTEAQLEAGRIDDLHAVYGGLGSGRLVIAGAPGSGKSSAAVLLVLAALKHREDRVRAEDRAKVPVPVLFTA